MSQRSTHTTVNAVAIADEALELLETTLSSPSRSGALDTQYLAGLGEQAAVDWSEYLEQQTEQLKSQLDAAGGAQ